MKNQRRFASTFFYLMQLHPFPLRLCVSIQARCVCDNLACVEIQCFRGILLLHLWNCLPMHLGEQHFCTFMGALFFAPGEHHFLTWGSITSAPGGALFCATGKASLLHWRKHHICIWGSTVFATGGTSHPCTNGGISYTTTNNSFSPRRLILLHSREHLI